MSHIQKSVSHTESTTSEFLYGFTFRRDGDAALSSRAFAVVPLARFSHKTVLYIAVTTATAHYCNKAAA